MGGRRLGSRRTGAHLERHGQEHAQAHEDLKRLPLQRAEDEEPADHSGHGREENESQIARPGLPRSLFRVEDEKAQQSTRSQKDEDGVAGVEDGERRGAEQQRKAKAGGGLQGRAGEGRDGDESDLHDASVVFDQIAKGLGGFDESAEGSRHVGESVVGGHDANVLRIVGRA